MTALTLSGPWLVLDIVLGLAGVFVWWLVWLVGWSPRPPAPEPVRRAPARKALPASTARAPTRRALPVATPIVATYQRTRALEEPRAALTQHTDR